LVLWQTRCFKTEKRCIFSPEFPVHFKVRSGTIDLGGHQTTYWSGRTTFGHQNWSYLTKTGSAQYLGISCITHRLPGTKRSVRLYKYMCRGVLRRFHKTPFVNGAWFGQHLAASMRSIYSNSAVSTPLE